MIFTVVSPDRLSMVMFIDYLKKIYLPDSVLCETGYMFDEVFQENMLKTLIGLDASKDVIVKYKATRKMNVPSAAIERLSDYIVKFDIYSTVPEVQKAHDPLYIEKVVSRWKENIDRMNE